MDERRINTLADQAKCYLREVCRQRQRRIDETITHLLRSTAQRFRRAREELNRDRTAGD